MMCLCFQAGAETNAFDDSNETPLMLACQKGYADIVRYVGEVPVPYPGIVQKVPTGTTFSFLKQGRKQKRTKFKLIYILCVPTKDGREIMQERQKSVRQRLKICRYGTVGR